MGSWATCDCRRISRRDLDWFESQAGVQVIAHPGDLLLNKDQSKQNMGVGFQTTVFAAPGSTTVANDIAAYCIYYDRFFPLAESFDVGPSGAELPGYDGVVKLLQLNAALQPSLDETITGMQAAIWNLTDGSPLDTSGTAEESLALLAQAQVAEDSVPRGLPGLPIRTRPPRHRSHRRHGRRAPGDRGPGGRDRSGGPRQHGELFPSRVRAGRRVRSDLLIGTAWLRTCAAARRCRCRRTQRRRLWGSARWRAGASTAARRRPPGQVRQGPERRAIPAPAPP